MSTSIGFVLGVLTGAAVTLLAGPARRSWSRRATPPAARYGLYGAAAVVTFLLSATLIYFAVGARSGTRQSETVNAAAPPHPGMPPKSSGQAQSLDAATSGLEARLNRDGGSAEEWLLLAQSYDFMGRSADADRARTRAAALKGTPAGTVPNATQPMNATSVASAAGAFDGTRADGAAKAPIAVTAPAAAASADDDMNASSDAATIGKLEARTRAAPQDAQSWLALASLYRSQRQYERARDSYARVIALHAMTAQSWADDADTLGSLSGGHIGADAAAAIHQALLLDSANLKALWLEASRDLQDRHFGDALEGWKRLRAALPPDSPDLRLVDANIAEASQLASGRGTRR
jgi:cytochrome c-type biogenesis protein CcmH/NrfG